MLTNLSKVKTIKKNSTADSLSKNIVENLCLTCGNNSAEYSSIQLRASDEPATEFWKCTKCGKTTRTS